MYMYEIVENAPLASYSTFHLGGIARYLIRCSHPQDVPHIVAFAQKKQLPLRVLGEGSNTLLRDGLLPYCFIKLTNTKITIIHETDASTYVEIGAGVLWDNAVRWAINHHLSGIEALSGIPGTCGAAPIQNIGAYGQELKDTLIEVRAYDIKKNVFISLPASLCAFGYRTSIFKTTHKNQYIITGIVLKLSKLPPVIPNYQDIKDYFTQKNINSPSLAQIRSAILKIRNNKLPNPNTIPNVGSFFKNPIVPKTKAEILQKQYPDLKIFPVSETCAKIPAGWLIEKCGLKGKSIGPVGIYEKNALVLINHDNATFEDVIHAQNIIVSHVKKLFAIELEREPEIIA